MKRYDHLFTLAFSVKTNAATVEDISISEFEYALEDRRLDIRNNANWTEAVGAPHDTIDWYNECPLEDWQSKVASGETTLGYQQWIGSIQGDRV